MSDFEGKFSGCGCVRLRMLSAFPNVVGGRRASSIADGKTFSWLEVFASQSRRGCSTRSGSFGWRSAFLGTRLMKLEMTTRFHDEVAHWDAGNVGNVLE